MKNIIFLTNTYLPKPGATGLCVHQIAKELAKNNKVYTVAYKSVEQVEMYDGVELIPIKAPVFMGDEQNGKQIRLRLLHLQSLFCKLIHIRKYPLRSSKLVNRYYKEAKKIIDKNGVCETTVVASYTPIEAGVAALKLKNTYGKDIKVVFYSTDTLSNEQGEDGILSSDYRFKLGTMWESKLFLNSDLSIIMECHEEHYRKLYGDFFEGKIRVANFPLLSCSNQKMIVKNNEKQKVRFVYTGTIYKNLRNPTYLLKLLGHLTKLIDMEVYFLGGCDCAELLLNAEKLSDGKIKYLGMQAHDVAEDYILSADILLSIGNADSPMAPSKIYEYMSTGKPIIHTYTYEKDPCINPLIIYNNSMLISEKKDLKIEDVKRFIENRKVLDYLDVEKKFNSSTPMYTAKIIEGV